MSGIRAVRIWEIAACFSAGVMEEKLGLVTSWAIGEACGAGVPPPPPPLLVPVPPEVSAAALVQSVAEGVIIAITSLLLAV